MSLDASARPEPDDTSSSFGAPRLNGQMAVLRLDLAADADGFRLQMQPATPRSVLESWSELTIPSVARTVLIDRQAGPLAAATVAEPGLLDRLLPLGGDRWMLVRVDGPVEAADLRALHVAALSGGSVFDAEIRAVVSAAMMGPRAAEFTAPDQAPLLSVIASSLRGYAASLLRTDPQLLALPDIRLIERLMLPSGRICIRPIESIMSSTAIDIGIDTAGAEGSAPANDALIYDLYGNGWHGD